MTQTVTQRLNEIRQRSLELWRIHSLPRIDPETGATNPFVVVGQADEDVKWLLDYVGTLETEIAHLEELLEDDEFEDERLEEPSDSD